MMAVLWACVDGQAAASTKQQSRRTTPYFRRRIVALGGKFGSSTGSEQPGLVPCGRSAAHGRHA